MGQLPELKRLPGFRPVQGPVVLVVMDGIGVGPGDEGDAVHLARTPHLDLLGVQSLSTTLRAHGRSVGLPSDKDMGNSEVGHNALGAGRVFSQGATRVNQAIQTREIFRGKTWEQATKTVRESGEPLHLLGLLSDGNVHSHIDHLHAMIDAADQGGVDALRAHVLLDGRDVQDGTSIGFIQELEKHLKKLRDAGRDYRIASGGGRMALTMDRYGADWAMVQRGWETHVRGNARLFEDAEQAVRILRSEMGSPSDQFLPPFVVANDRGQPCGPIRDGAAVINLNFRGDRAIEISQAFSDDVFAHFDRSPRPHVYYAGMMQYDGDLKLPQHYLVEPPEIDRTLGEYLARQKIEQFACSETQKFGHVTYFWNGNRSGKFDEKFERYLEIPSDSTPFDEHPEMKAHEITEATLAEIGKGTRHIRINYANGDMVGHTGNLAAAIRAVETVDQSVGRLRAAVQKAKGALIVTADHGNADEMWMRKGGKILEPRAAKTSHTLNPVPFYMDAQDPDVRVALRSDLKDMGLASVASTVLHLLGYVPPEGYEPSLLTSPLASP